MIRPKVIINAAMSADGKIALVGGKRIRISDDADFKRVHELRASVDAILVGINTVLMDNPKLTVKEKYVPDAKNPVRVVLDSHLRIPAEARVLNDAAPTIIGTTVEAPERSLNAEIIRCGHGRVELKCLLRELYARGIRKLMVEGGSEVIYSFLSEHLADEMYIFVGSMIIGGSAPTLAGGTGAREEEEVLRMKLLSCEPLGYGVLLHYALGGLR
ncbi:MAG: 2,5-diamino-6-(ribosylamino)-4(3H)-pyrimidinone 5'-phosphate reductase [Euryarchaeota archaeon]|nr:2,5-diamino-6-(ribosylamino)-4(3H)-pyrimidinone 5'-phosphate reductase [Euryarchaeota archaeon]